jgi:hypothetical protein
MKTRGLLASKARQIVAEHGVSMRQAYRYVAAGREPSADVRIGIDGRQYHVHLRPGAYDQVRVRRIRYMISTVTRQARLHGITDSDMAELEGVTRCIKRLAAEWRGWFAADAGKL